VIETLSYIKYVAWAFLSNPVLMMMIAGVFWLGRRFGTWTRGFDVWKYIALGYFGILIFRPLETVGLIFGGVFILGVATMYQDLFREVFAWSGGIREAVSAFRYRSAFEEIKRLERELEELKRRFNASQIAGAAPAGANTQQQWREQSQARKTRSSGPQNGARTAADGGQTRGSTFGQQSGSQSSRTSPNSGPGRNGPKPTSGKTANSSNGPTSNPRRGPSGAAPNSKRSSSTASGKSSSQSRSSGSGSQRQSGSTSSTQSQGTSFSLRDKHLQTLELVPGQVYTEKDIKAAWRRMAFKTHPDKGGSTAAFSAAYNAYKALR
tara:strand:- start:9598 stop:10563 length:966 start_codon:yes stop_codon:yes gene_type:complete